LGTIANSPQQLSDSINAQLFPYFHSLPKDVLFAILLPNWNASDVGGAESRTLAKSFSRVDKFFRLLLRPFIALIMPSEVVGNYIDDSKEEYRYSCGSSVALRTFLSLRKDYTFTCDHKVWEHASLSVFRDKYKRSISGLWKFDRSSSFAIIRLIGDEKVRDKYFDSESIQVFSGSLLFPGVTLNDYGDFVFQTHPPRVDPLMLNDESVPVFEAYSFAWKLRLPKSDESWRTVSGNFRRSTYSYWLK
jgi:hypothetical protein